MAGYSGKPLSQKIGIKSGSSLFLHNSPLQVRELFPDLDATVQVVTELDASRPLDVILTFAASLADLQSTFLFLSGFIKKRGALWVAWPKKSSTISSNVDENKVRAIGLAAGLVDVKVCAIDDTWSGLKFVLRVK